MSSWLKLVLRPGDLDGKGTSCILNELGLSKALKDMSVAEGKKKREVLLSHCTIVPPTYLNASVFQQSLEKKTHFCKKLLLWSFLFLLGTIKSTAALLAFVLFWLIFAWGIHVKNFLQDLINPRWNKIKSLTLQNNGQDADEMFGLSVLCAA